MPAVLLHLQKAAMAVTELNGQLLTVQVVAGAVMPTGTMAPRLVVYMAAAVVVEVITHLVVPPAAVPKVSSLLLIHLQHLIFSQYLTSSHRRFK